MRLVLALGLLLAGAPQGEEIRYASWDRFYYNVPLPVPPVAPEGTLRVLVYHSYPTPLHDVRVVAASSALQVRASPPALRVLDPTVIETVRLHLRRKATGRATASDQTRLELEFRARELPRSRRAGLVVPLTAAGATEVSSALAVPVGSVEIRVGGLRGQEYFLYLVPTLALLAWFLWRRRRMG